MNGAEDEIQFVGDLGADYLGGLDLSGGDQDGGEKTGDDAEDSRV